MAIDPSELPDSLVQPARELVDVFEIYKVGYALIGGVAVGYRGRPRTTLDLDFLVSVPQVVLPKVLDELLVRGFEFDTLTVIRQWIQEQMTVISYRGATIDWLKPVVACYQRVIERATLEPWRGMAVRIAAPEGLIVMKLIAFRPQDRVDIQNLLAGNRGRLDLDFMEREWETVGERDDPRMLEFREMVREYYPPLP